MKPTAGAAETKPPKLQYDSSRETVESIVIALVLAFLFKTFEGEAFVIPTGSMAPTLRGLHKDVASDVSGEQFAVGVQEPRDLRFDGPPTIVSCATPNYGYRMPIEPNTPDLPAPTQHYYSYSGDRILVSKLAYLNQAPQRWDVVVFKCPNEASVNYIKRLVGREEEEIGIEGGDIIVRGPNDAEAVHATKPDRVLQEMLQIVFDADFEVELKKSPVWPPLRWIDPAIAPAWQRTQLEPRGATYQVAAAADQIAWLRYQHTLPTFDDWRTYDFHRGAQVPTVKRRLITDFTPYNCGRLPRPEVMTDSPSIGILGMNWVPDLAVEADLDIVPVAGQPGEVVLELVKGGFQFQARIALDTGKVEMQEMPRPGSASKLPVWQGQTPIRGAGTHHIAFSNVDYELRLWVDGQRIVFDQPTTYTPWEAVPQLEDLLPAGIGARGCTVTARHLKLWRDIYYIARGHSGVPITGEDGIALPYGPSGSDLDRTFGTVAAWSQFFSDPTEWPAAFKRRSKLAYKLEKDQFFVLGDNSASSFDARAWDRGQQYVERRLMIGRALFIYWPHGWETPWHVPIPGNFFAGGSLRVPFVPNLERMKFIY